MSDLTLAVKALDEVQKPHDKALNYYEGTQPEVFASPKLKRALGRTGMAWRLNFARTVVTSVLDRLEISAVTTTDARIQSFLDEVRVNNNFGMESDDTHQWGLVFGEAYVIVWPDEDGEVEIAYNSPRTTRVFYDPENPKRKKFAAKVWETGDEKVRVNLYYRDRIEKYISRGIKPDSERDFIRHIDAWDETEDANGEVVSNEVWPIPNPWGELPVFHLRTERPYGRPEHFDAYSPQDMVNKLVITQMSTNDFHGFPQRYALAGGRHEDPEDYEDDFDFDLGSEEPSDDDETGSGSSSLKSGPGELWWLEGVDSVGQFPAAEVANFLEPLREYIKAMATLTSTPLHHFLGFGGQEPSGESKRLSESPLIKKVSDRQQNFESFWKEVFTFAAKIGLDVDEVLGLTITWAPTQSHDDKDAWETATAKQEAGVPRTRALVEQGYSEDEVNEWYPDGDGFDIGAVAEHLGTIVQRLALGIETGVLTTEQSNAILEPLIARLAPNSADDD